MTRRNRLLAATCVIALGVGATEIRPAYALFGMGDVVFDPSVFAQVEQQATTGLHQLEQIGQGVNVARSQLTQLTTFYQSFAHITDISGLASVLNSPLVQSAMPGQVADIERQLSGTGQFTGRLASLVQQFRGQNLIYTPASGTWGFQSVSNAANSTAGQMAAAESLYQAATQRINGFQELKDRIATSSDPKTTLDLQARLLAEQGQAQATAGQAQALQIWQSAQDRNEREQADQAWRQAAHNLTVNAEAAASSAGRH